MSYFALQVLKRAMLSQESAAVVAPHCSVISFPPSSSIYQRGSHPMYWFYVMNGLVGEQAIVDNDFSALIRVHGERSWFGESYLILERPGSCDFLSITSVQLLCIPLPLLRERWKHEPEFSLHIAKSLAWSVQNQSQLLILMKRGNPLVRFIMGVVLLGEAITYGSLRPPTIGYGSSVEIEISQTQLSSYLGISRTLVSEFCRAFEADGWLITKYRSFEIPMLDVWRRLVVRRIDEGYKDVNPTVGQVMVEMRKMLM